MIWGLFVSILFSWMVGCVVYDVATIIAMLTSMLFIKIIKTGTSKQSDKKATHHVAFFPFSSFRDTILLRMILSPGRLPASTSAPSLKHPITDSLSTAK